MAEQGFLTTRENIQKGNIKRCYFLYGFNEFLGEFIIKDIRNQHASYNYQKFYLDKESSHTWEDIIQYSLSSTLFDDEQKITVAVVRETTKLTIKKKEKETLKNYLKDSGNSNILIVYISMDFTKDKYQDLKKKSLKTTISLFNNPQTEVVNLDLISNYEVQKIINQYLQKYNRKINQQAMQKIMQIKGKEIISFLSQLPKLSYHGSGNKEINIYDIENYSTNTIKTESIWNLTDALENKNIKEYIEILKYLYNNGIKSMLISATLISHYTRLYQVALMQQKGYPQKKITEELKLPPFVISKIISLSEKNSLKKTEKIITLLFNIDKTIKRSSENIAKLHLETFILQI